MRTSAEIAKTIAVIKNQVGAFRGRTEGREMSAAERKTLGELEAELRAQEGELTDAQEAERRHAAYAGWTTEAVASMSAHLGRLDPQEQRDQRVAEILAMPSAPSGQQISTRERADAAEMTDLRAFLRGETRASMSTTDGNGGYLLPHAAVERVIDLVKKVDPFLARASSFSLAGTAMSVEVPVQSAEGVVSWVSETDTRDETSSPTFGSQVITAFEAYGNWLATQQFLDSQPYVEDWIINELGKALLQAAGIKFAIGAGTTEILGAFANTSSGYTIRESGDADALLNTAFPLAFYDLSAAYHPGAAWVMAPATLATVTGFTWPNSFDTPLVQYSAVDGAPTIMGKPVLLDDSAPAIDTNTFPVFFGDIAAAYGVAIHSDINVLRDPYTDKPKVGFYGTLRIGGHPLDNKAGVLIECAEAPAVS